ncbi:hypothetical protein F0U44_21930 [Nocardioides humilatus]|uniref:Carboxypeptidase regulatory-like domain-containing protein n=1 Tax=Nocardioides humilatus TaxID=2607660 RepID=A0A5B1L4B8_9ACTN|nr:hypothetical protein [Nocardioides humilatus]KAA1415345.1 hypothetical protein F0U44_21930 [Nocardioides humilatus]
MRRTASAIALAAVAALIPVATSTGSSASAAPAAVSRTAGTPTFVSGTVVNAATGNELRGIVVTVRDVDARGTVIGRDTTDINGHFRIPVDVEELAVRVNGEARGYETGWVTCSPHRVVPTWGQACSQGATRLGRVKLDHL